MRWVSSMFPNVISSNATRKPLTDRLRILRTKRTTSQNDWKTVEKQPRVMDNQQNVADQDLDHFRYICDICGQNNLTDIEMKMHMATTHKDDFVCLFCDLKGVTHDEMTLHINSVHFNDSFVRIETRKMEEEQNCEDYTLMKKNDYVFSDTKETLSFYTESERKMETDESKLKTGGTEESADSAISSNSCNTKINECCINYFSCSCEKVAAMNKVEETKLGVDSNTSSPGNVTENIVQLTKPNINIQSLLENQSDFIPETEMESNLCPICDFVTDDGYAIERHLTSEHSDKFLDEITKEESFNNDNSCRRTPLFCPICGSTFQEYSFLQFHINGHFREDLQATRGAENVINNLLENEENGAQMTKFSQQPEGNWNFQADQKALNCSVAADCNASAAEKVRNEKHFKSFKLVVPSILDRDDRSSSTEGVIEKLLSHYNKNCDIKHFWLCSNLDHFSTRADRGWGCGYRNLQMLLSCLTKCSIYKAEVFQGLSTIPSLNKIQSLLEDAWRKGFDQTGSVHFQGTILNTKKWIGATEVVTLLSSLQIRCSLVDFHTPTGSNNTHPLLFDWIKRYFQTPEPFKLPLYFQHQGHSRTIVGMEEHHDGSLRLLAFDPGVPHTTMKQYLQIDNTTHLVNCLRKSITDLKHKQYQIVAVCGLMDKPEMEESKILKSTRIP